MPRPDQVKLEYSLRLGFKASNNEEEYEALIIELKMARSKGARRLYIYIDFQLVVKQIKSEYQTKRASMISYSEMFKGLLKGFKEHHITQILMAENSNANSLAKLASATESELVHMIHVETLKQPSIIEKKQEVKPTEERPG